MNSYQNIENDSRRRNLRVLMGVRVAAFCGQLAAIFYCYYGLSIVLPVAAMVLTASILVLFNLYALLRLRSGRPIGQVDLMLGLVADVVVLAVQLNFSGGTSNPFVSFFMLPVIIGAVMLQTRLAWAIYGLTLLCYGALAVADLYRPMPAMSGMAGMAVPGLVDRSMLHMHGMMLGYAVCAAVLVFMISRVRANLEMRDHEIERLRTEAIEQDHLSRLGLLTAGAAHELGTPLTTMSIIIKDWQDLGIPAEVDERDSELTTLANQVGRCKAVISDILDATGQTRGEGASAQPLRTFVSSICAQWLGLNPGATLTTDLKLDDRTIAADKVFAQSLVNMLDNALEASRSAGHDAVEVVAVCDQDRLVVDITDRGPGFDADVLRKIGKPFVTTKAEQSDRTRGLGLFLVANTAKALSGELTFTEAEVGGCKVRLNIPVASLSVANGH